MADPNNIAPHSTTTVSLNSQYFFLMGLPFP
jgi:hypothetical protein